MVENVISEISGETTIKGIWNKLEHLYVKKFLTNRLILLKTFFTMSMKDGISIKEHLGFFKDLVMKIKTVNLKVDEEHMDMMLMCFLSERYTGFANSFIFARDTMIVEDVKLSLLSENLRDQMKEMGEGRGGSSSQGLFAKRGERRRRIGILGGVSNLESPIIIIEESLRMENVTIIKKTRLLE